MTKKQAIVSWSSIEVEYRAMPNATSEVVYIRNLLKFLGIDVGTTKLHCDNQATLHISANPVFHECTKHIEIDCHFIREKDRVRYYYY